jgi:hypothetical protein
MDPACPATTNDGTTATITGGCIDLEGVERFGSATIVRGAAGTRTATFDGYGETSPIGTPLLTGSVEIREVSATSHEFDVDLVHEGGVTTTVVYAGTVEGTYGTRTVWNGSGTVTRRGPVRPTGTVEVSTTDEVLDDALCTGQAASGSTSISAGGREVVITYDGAVECDTELAARWSVDGEDRGTILGIVCAAAHPRAGRQGGAFALVAIAMLAVSRRIRKHRRPPIR